MCWHIDSCIKVKFFAIFSFLWADFGSGFLFLCFRLAYGCITSNGLLIDLVIYALNALISHAYLFSFSFFLLFVWIYWDGVTFIFYRLLCTSNCVLVSILVWWNGYNYFNICYEISFFSPTSLFIKFRFFRGGALFFWLHLVTCYSNLNFITGVDSSSCIIFELYVVSYNLLESDFLYLYIIYCFGSSGSVVSVSISNICLLILCLELYL